MHGGNRDVLVTLICVHTFKSEMFPKLVKSSKCGFRSSIKKIANGMTRFYSTYFLITLTLCFPPSQIPQSNTLSTC